MSTRECAKNEKKAVEIVYSNNNSQIARKEKKEKKNRTARGKKKEPNTIKKKKKLKLNFGKVPGVMYRYTPAKTATGA